MSDQNVETVENTDAATESQNLNSDTTNTQSEQVENTQDSKKQEQKVAKTFSQEDVNRIVKRELDAANKKLAEEKANAELSESERLKKQLADKDKELAETKLDRLKDRVAAKHGLPERLRNKLSGDTEEELEEDAVEMAKLLAPKKPNAPNLDGENGGNTGPTVATFEEQVAVAKQMGLKPPTK